MSTYWKTATLLGTFALLAPAATAQSVTTSAPAVETAGPALQLMLSSLGMLQPASFAVPSLAVGAAMNQIMASADDAEVDVPGTTGILPGAFGNSGIITGLPSNRGGAGRNSFARHNGGSRRPNQNHGRRGGGASGSHGGGHRVGVPHIPSTGVHPPTGR